MLPGVLFVLNIAVGFLGLRLVNVPMFLAVRRTTTVFVMLGEWAILSRTPSSMAVTAVALIATGTVVAGSQTFAAEFMGFLFTIGNNILTASTLPVLTTLPVCSAFMPSPHPPRLVAVGLNISRKFSDETSTSGFGMVYYNSLTALPLSLALVVLSGELSTLQAFEGYTVGFWAATGLASCLGVVMTFAVFWCTTTNSPVVTSVAGNMKDIVSTFIGAILFPGFVSSPATITGLLVAFSGSSLYTYAKLTGQALVDTVSSGAAKKDAAGGTAEELAGLVEGAEADEDHNA